MSKGFSLHIAGGAVDESHYAGWGGGTSQSCTNDANSLAELAKACGFETLGVLCGFSATSGNTLGCIAKAADQLASGDFFLLTFAGEGAQIPDVNHDEPNGMDDTWVLYDRMLIDDELNGCWNLFKPGVRVLLVSDSCSSGTIISIPFAQTRYTRAQAAKTWFNRTMPAEVAVRTYCQNEQLYNTLQAAANMNQPKSSVISLTSSKDGSPSISDSEHGLFTRSLLNIWNNGEFSGNYGDLYSSIYLDLKRFQQRPDYHFRGALNLSFQNQRPFTINA